MKDHISTLDLTTPDCRAEKRRFGMKIVVRRWHRSQHIQQHEKEMP